MPQIVVQPSTTPDHTEVWWGEELVGLFHEKNQREQMVTVIHELMYQQVSEQTENRNKKLQNR